MRFATGVVAAASLASEVLAFPGVLNIAAEPKAVQAPKHKRVNGIAPGFDAKAQYISTSGQYTWVAPGPTDQRGPCPGLNAFANHGYMPHNGIATITQFIDATTHVVGMGVDLATFLAVYGAVFDGDLTSWSIGGPDPRVGIIGLGEPYGISGSHNKYEGDVSPSRGDLYQYGNDYKVVVSQFTEQYGTQAAETEETSNYDLGVLTSFRAARFQQSLNENPYFFNNFFSGVLVQPAAYTFQYRFMANHSEEYPEGRLSQSVLKDWFAITGDYPNFSYTPGYERIPDNWYRRAYGDEYTIPFFLEDVVAAASDQPEFLNIGGNTGTVNSFTPINIVNVTQGLYNTDAFSDPATLGCFVYELLLLQAPDILAPLGDGLVGALGQLTSALSPLKLDTSCPQLSSLSAKQFNAAAAQFPGFSKLKSDGTY